MKHEKKMIQLLLRNRLFREFSAAELVEILPLIAPEQRRFERGEVIVQIDDPAQRIGLVVSGSVILVREGNGECIHELSRRVVDDVFGLTAFFSGPGKSPVTVVAAEDTEVILFDIRSLLTDDKYKDKIKNTALLVIANYSVRNMLRLDVLLSPSMRERIMTYFKTMRDKHESDCFQIKPNQTALADYLKVNRSALSRELNKMQREGILEILPNRRYHILKWKANLPDPQQVQVNTKQMDTGSNNSADCC